MKDYEDSSFRQFENLPWPLLGKEGKQWRPIAPEFPGLLKAPTIGYQGEVRWGYNVIIKSLYQCEVRKDFLIICRFAHCPGSITVNVVPLPNSLSTVIIPPCA